MNQAGAATLKQQPWDLWMQQIQGILRLELKKYFLGRRALIVYLLATAPVALLSLGLIVPFPVEALQSMGGTSVLYAVVFRTFFIRLVVFLGCVTIFMNLFRGEVLERTLHYYLLTPVRRSVLVAGKFTAGVIVTFVLFGVSVILSYIVLFLPTGLGALQAYFFQGPGLGHLAAYLGITLFACVGYGALFLLLGLFFRNPIIPAAVVLGWESINFLLPPLLKMFSVIYYLESLCPVAIPEGPVKLLADPAPLWQSGPGLIALTALVLWVATWRLRQMEINYGDD